MLAIIPTRLNSTRLPGKALLEIGGKPMIQYLIERIEHAGFDVLLIMPEREHLGPLHMWAIKNGIDCLVVAGIGEDDVAARFRVALETFKPRHFMRLCHDSPLVDPRLMLTAANIAEVSGVPLVSNPGYPHGQQVEVVKTEFFLEREKIMTSLREHVTAALYPYAAAKEWVTFGPGHMVNTWPRLTVDTPEDFARMTSLIGRMDRDHRTYGWHECLRLAQQV